MKYASLASVVVAVTVWPLAASAASPQLNGSYAFSGMGSCLYSGGPFNSDNSPTVWPGFPFPHPGGNGIFTSNFSVEGMRTFNGDGTGSLAGRAVEIVGPPSVNPRVSVEDFQAQFTYALDGNGGFSVQLVPGSFISTSVSPVSGQKVQTDGIVLNGLIGNNNSVLSLASTDAVVETQTAQNFAFVPAAVTGSNDITVRYRICARARTLDWTGPNK
jgi:hypothetical protein